MADAAERLRVVQNFIKQAPPGQVNDVFSDIRAIVADDAALEAGVRPALEAYNLAQYTAVELPGQPTAALLCEAAQNTDEPTRYIDPRSSQTFAFDHVELTASELEEFEPHSELEPVRLEIQKALTEYAEEHYSQGLASVFSLSQPFPASPRPKSQEEAEDAKNEQDMQIDTPAPIGGAETTADAPIDAKDTSERNVQSEETAEKETEPIQDSATESITEDNNFLKEIPNPKKTFGLYIVGNRYNPSNFWSGRWRSHYDFDAEAGSLTGEILVNVHYYEQGNVQLQTSLPVKVTLPANTKNEALSKAVVKAISNAEKEYQVALNEAYAEMSDKMFKDLRRALPITKQKMNWNRIANYKLSSELQKA